MKSWNHQEIGENSTEICWNIGFVWSTRWSMQPNEQGLQKSWRPVARRRLLGAQLDCPINIIIIAEFADFVGFIGWLLFGFHNTLDSVSENTGGSMDLSALDKSSLQFDHVHPWFFWFNRFVAVPIWPLDWGSDGLWHQELPEGTF